MAACLDFSFFLKNVCVRPLIGVVTFALRVRRRFYMLRTTSARQRVFFERGFRSFSFEIFKTARLRRDLLAIAQYISLFDQTNKPKEQRTSEHPNQQ